MRRLGVSIAIASIWLVAPGASLASQIPHPGLPPQTRDQVPDRLVPVGTSSISGAVTAEESGRPLRSARVEIEGRLVANLADLSLARTAYTDAGGQFSFPRLPAGRFTIAVYAENYLSHNYGQRRHEGRGRTISLTDGQQMTVRIPMQRGGVITGIVLSSDGEPVPDIGVRAVRYDLSRGFMRAFARRTWKRTIVVSIACTAWILASTS